MLKSFQKKYLRGIAHRKKPIVHIGQKGLSTSLYKSIDKALEKHELIKIKFNEFKEKSSKKEMEKTIEKQHHCESVGMIGHTIIIYRQNPNPEKRTIILPERKSAFGKSAE
jgi:RNA-binding protein